MVCAKMILTMRARQSFSLILIFLLLTSCATDPFSSVKDEELRLFYGRLTSLDLEYHLYYPEIQGESFPLIYYHHGQGAKGEPFVKEHFEFAKKKKIALLAVTRNRNFSQEVGDIKKFWDLIEKVTSEHPINTDKILLVGVSAGAFISQGLLRDYQGEWSGAVLVSMPHFEDWLKKGDQIITVPPLLVIHGEEDDSFPLEAIEKKLDELRMNQVDIQLEVLEAGHAIGNSEWEEKFKKWLKKQEFIN